jgi:D-alanyl-lipoteichoic acid acyltransferase DltB (MBOAT superfamily)
MQSTEKKLTERESLDLITSMINKAKNSFHDTGIGAIMWGIVVAISALVKLAEIHFDFRLPFDIFLLTFIAIIPQIFISMKEKKERQVRSHDDVVMDYLWASFGICILLLSHFTNNVEAGLKEMNKSYEAIAGQRPAFHFYEYGLALFLMLYGLPTFVTGAIMKFKPMIYGGIFCWVCCVAVIYTPVKVDLLLTALSAIVAWLIPGIILQKHYRKAKRQRALLNV